MDIPLDTLLRNPRTAGTQKRDDGGDEGDAGGVWEESFSKEAIEEKIQIDHSVLSLFCLSR